MQPKITIIGAGAAGLFCASLLGKRGFDVTVIDNGKKIGRKILMSGGGKCNFTNLSVAPHHYLSQNPHFCKSALKRFTPWDFIALIHQYHIAYHEKEQGQLFCDTSAQEIVSMLQSECQKGKVTFSLQTQLNDVALEGGKFSLQTSKGIMETDKLIIATGGLSMPALGVTPIGYRIAEKFSLPVVPVKAGLVPLTLHKSLLDQLSVLAGISVLAEVITSVSATSTTTVAANTKQNSFKGNVLFTHRGLSGPAILQISNYWQQGTSITINLLPDMLSGSQLHELLEQNRNQTLKNALSQILPKRLVEVLIDMKYLPDAQVKQLNHRQRNAIFTSLTHWAITPNGTEGYRTAEVTLGGVDTKLISSKSMQVNAVPNLYFIGEVLDVTGWLGGYNFQWAWSSAYACATEMQ